MPSVTEMVFWPRLLPLFRLAQEFLLRLRSAEKLSGRAIGGSSSFHSRRRRPESPSSSWSPNCWSLILFFILTLVRPRILGSWGLRRAVGQSQMRRRALAGRGSRKVLVGCRAASSSTSPRTTPALPLPQPGRFSAPDQICVASDLLTHSDRRTTPKHYNRARGIEASRAYRQVIAGLRNKQRRLTHT